MLFTANNVCGPCSHEFKYTFKFLSILGIFNQRVNSNSMSTENTKKIWRRSASQGLSSIQLVNGTDSELPTNHVNQDTSTKEPITLAVIGCGQRGDNYAVYATQEPTKCKIVAVAEPRPVSSESQIHLEYPQCKNYRKRKRDLPLRIESTEL